MVRLLTIPFVLFLFATVQLGIAQQPLAGDFYDSDNVHDVKIYFEDANWETKLDNLKKQGSSKRLTAKVVVDGRTVEDAGIRYKGNSSYFNPKNKEQKKLPFNIEANHSTDDQTFDKQVETLKLSNVFRDPSFLREVLSYEIASQYMASPRATYARVYINDEYYGLYNLTQSVDDFFLKYFFGNDDGVLFKCDPVWHAKAKPGCPEGDKASLMYLGDNPACYSHLYELKSDTGWYELIELTRILNQKPEQIEEVLDVNQALWMLAYNSVLVNLDSYTGRLCHNYYLYQQSNGQFVTIPWDMNLSFGGFRFAGLGKGLTTEEMQTLSPFVHYKTKNLKRPLITQLLSIDLYRKIYAGQIRTILAENFANGRYIERMEALRAEIDEYVKEDPLNLYDYDGFQKNWKETATAGRSEIVGIVELMESRTEYLMNHSVVGVAPPVVDTIKYLKIDNELAIQAKIEDAENAYLVYRTAATERFKRVPMFDDGGHIDEMLEDDIWAAVIPYQEGMDYYIIAEGTRTASLSPARAGVEYHTVPGDLR
jgi:hypothetical protein